jgi:hypothetical protein
MVVYQNFPCELRSLGSTSAPASAAKPGSKNVGVPQQPSSEIALGRSVASTQPPMAPGVPHVGMSAEDVRKIWGDPRETTKEEFVKGDIETWTYADSRSIQFDRKGRVTAIRW